MVVEGEEEKPLKLRLPILVVPSLLIMSVFTLQVESGTSTNALYAHAETPTVVNYFAERIEERRSRNEN